MRIGLIADIHEDAPVLEKALEMLRREGFDQLVVLGDVADNLSALEETTQLLLDAGAIGVWGNHELGLCLDPDPEYFEGLAPCVQAFMSTLEPALTIEDCFFSHAEPWLDPCSPLDLNRAPEWDLETYIDLSFRSREERLLFHGHRHRWQVVSPEGLVDWTGDHLSCPDGVRYAICVGPLSHGPYDKTIAGHFAIYDTGERHLTRMRAGAR